jgi:dihydrofolate reductase
MGQIIYENSISLDGYVTGPNDGHEFPMGEGGMQLFDWYNNGDVDVQLPGTDMHFKVSPASAKLIQERWPTFGAGIVGRRTFDIAHAWGGKPPGGSNLVVLTHNPPREWLKDGSPFTFVTEGIEEAVRQAKALAGDKNISIDSASIAQQCLKAGLLDMMQLDIVPVLLGSGKRLFDNIGTKTIELESVRIVEGVGVTHHIYRVVK